MSQSIQVSFVQEGDVYTVHTGSSVLKDIIMDYTGVPETERGGNSSTLLIAAALSCFCGSIRCGLWYNWRRRNLGCGACSDTCEWWW